MALRTSLLRQLENPDLNRNSRALLRCQLARELENRGDYEEAREVMGELWQRVDERPNVEKLEPATAAEVLMRAGVLTGHLADRYQIENAQERAKNLLSEASNIFESLDNRHKILEAQTEISVCYWRDGSYDEARIILKEVIAHLKTDDELKAKAVLRSAIVERAATQYKEAFCILTQASALFDKISNHTLRGSYHNELAIVLRNLGTRENRGDYIDRAFMEYTAAGFHFEEAHHKCYSANVENNLGFLHFKAGRYKEAHRHLDRARHLLVRLKDKGTLAQIDDTRARVFLAQGNYKEAERVARTAVYALEKGGRQSLLAEALTTHGAALAHLGYYEQARRVFQRAIELAQIMGAPCVEAEAELRKVDEKLVEQQGQPSGSELSEEMHRYEAKLIKQALIRGKLKVWRVITAQRTRRGAEGLSFPTSRQSQSQSPRPMMELFAISKS
jgi:tetratricopeptide (TPR) repeat protein